MFRTLQRRRGRSSRPCPTCSCSSRSRLSARPSESALSSISEMCGWPPSPHGTLRATPATAARISDWPTEALWHCHFDFVLCAPCTRRSRHWRHWVAVPSRRCTCTATTTTLSRRIIPTRCSLSERPTIRPTHAVTRSNLLVLLPHIVSGGEEGGEGGRREYMPCARYAGTKSLYKLAGHHHNSIRSIDFLDTVSAFFCAVSARRYPRGL